MEIKRGITAPRSHSNSKIKNEEFAQLFYSFVNQRPGTARSSKKVFFLIIHITKVYSNLIIPMIRLRLNL
ncbi:Uncharacterised protein [Mammaliicoccus lentus]|nr:Uncharacterised protein [Mammaliicoccus lentus]